MPKYRGSITFKAEIAALLAGGNVGSHALLLDDNDILLLLRAAIELLIAIGIGFAVTVGMRLLGILIAGGINLIDGVAV